MTFVSRPGILYNLKSFQYRIWDDRGWTEGKPRTDERRRLTTVQLLLSVLRSSVNDSSL